MMRSRPSLKNSIKSVRLFSAIFLSLLYLCGCQNRIEPTYKEKDIPNQVKKICKDEYSLKVITKRLPTTLWVYIPIPKILHKDYGLKEGKVFDEGLLEKLRNLFTAIGRVLISSDNTPEFFAILASDINLGLDYTIIGNVLDIKKSYAEFIPWTESNRRYVIDLRESPEAINDTTGKHFYPYDIKLADFLALQIAGRISSHFQEEALKGYFKIENSEGMFKAGKFIFKYSIKQISPPEKAIDIKKEIIRIISYCLQTYEFKDFYSVEMRDLLTQESVVLGKDVIWAEPVF